MVPFSATMRAAWLALMVVPWVWLPTAHPAPRATSSVATRGGHGRPACAGVSIDGYCLGAARCGAGELDLDGFCLSTAGAVGGEVGASLETNAHVDRHGRRVVYEHLPRRRELPADYDRYVYPVPPTSDGHTVTSGYDLERPDELQRRGESLSAVGHGGVDLPQERGTPVKVVSLRGEVGEPEVVFVGVFFGNSVILRHVVREGQTLRTYLAIHGHLDAPAPNVARGMAVRPGTTIGFVGDSGALGIIHLHYEVRLLRPGIDPMRIEPIGRLTDQEVSVPCDPRNVLPYQ